MVTHDPRRVPLSTTRFQAVFPKLRTTAYQDISASSAPTRALPSRPGAPSSRAPPPSTSTTASGASLRHLAWSPLGNYIATASSARVLRVWNPERANVKHSTELKGHSGTVERTVWNPMREAEVASVGGDGTLRVWDVRTRKLAMEVKVGRELFTCSWRGDGEELVVGSKDDTLFKISLSAASIISTHAQPLQTNHTTFSASGSDLFLTHGDGTVAILDYASMTPLHSFRAHTSSCFAIDLSPTGTHLAVGGTDALVTLWDTRDLVCVRGLDRLGGPVRAVSFSWCGGYVVGGGEEERALEIAHVDTGEYVHRIEAPAPVGREAKFAVDAPGGTPGGAMPIVQWSPRDYSLAYALNDGGNGGLRVVGAGALERQ